MPFPIGKIVTRAQRMIIVGAVSVLAVLIAVPSVARYRAAEPQTRKINYTTLAQIAESGSATALVVEGETLTVTSKDGSTLEAIVAAESFRQGLVEQFRKQGVPIEFRSLQP